MPFCVNSLKTISLEYFFSSKSFLVLRIQPSEYFFICKVTLCVIQVHSYLLLAAFKFTILWCTGSSTSVAISPLCHMTKYKFIATLTPAGPVTSTCTTVTSTYTGTLLEKNLMSSPHSTQTSTTEGYTLKRIWCHFHIQLKQRDTPWKESDVISTFNSNWHTYCTHFGIL